MIRNNHRNVFQEIKEGIQYIKRSEALGISVIISAIVFTFAMNNDVNIPVFAKTVLMKGAAGYTALMSAAGIGSLFAAIIIRRIPAKHGVKKQLLILDGFFIFGFANYNCFYEELFN